MKQEYKYYNGYTGQEVDSDYAKNATLPQYCTKVDVSMTIGKVIKVNFYHHVNNGSSQCNCFMCSPRFISSVAKCIKLDWPNVWFGAVPYVRDMLTIGNISDSFLSEDGFSIVNYGLSNMSTYKGIVAKCIKNELKYYAKRRPSRVASRF